MKCGVLCKQRDLALCIAAISAMCIGVGRRLDRGEVEWRAFPGALQSFASYRDQFSVSFIRFTLFRPDQEKRHVNACLRLTQSRDAKWNLDQFFEIVTRIIARARGFQQFREVFSDRILDHRFVGCDNEGGAGGEISCAAVTLNRGPGVRTGKSVGAACLDRFRFLDIPNSDLAVRLGSRTTRDRSSASQR